MKAKEIEEKICKKIKYKSFDSSDIKILLGLIVKDTGSIIIFQTARKRYAIPKNRVISISDTDEIFQEGGVA